MRTGVCTTDFEASGVILPAEELFAKIKSYGFSCVQFAFSSIAECGFTPDGELEIPAVIPEEAIRAAKAAAEKYGLPIIAVNGTFNMAHPDPAVREEGLRRFALLVEAAGRLGAKYISLCSGTRNAAHLWTYSEENDTPEAWEAMADTVKKAVRLAEAGGIVLAIESEAANIIDTPENARRIMEEVGSDHLKMILDCANLFHRGEAKPENVHRIIGHAMEMYGRDVVIAHGKDIRAGDGIDFCGTGRGIVDFAYTADLLRQYGCTGDMFLHGIYDGDDMIRAREHWERCAG